MSLCKQKLNVLSIQTINVLRKREWFLCQMLYFYSDRNQNFSALTVILLSLNQFLAQPVLYSKMLTRLFMVLTKFGQALSSVELWMDTSHTKKN